MEIGPGRSVRDHIVRRGLILGAAIGFGAGLTYLVALVVVSSIWAAAFSPNLGQTASGDLISSLVIFLLRGYETFLAVLFGLAVGVLPATVAGGMAGAANGAVQRLLGFRQGRVAAGLTGILISTVVATVAVILILVVAQSDLLLSPMGVIGIWLPVVIFVLAGGLFPCLLRDRLVNPACSPTEG